MDKAAVEVDGFSEIELMHRAGSRVWTVICERWPELNVITVFTGSGNNGGDAFVVANLARQQGVGVQLIVKGDLSRQSETSRHYSKAWFQAGGEVEEWQQQVIKGDIIVDGLLGIGLVRELDEDWQDLVGQINQNAAPKIAIDIPSGLSAETGTAKPCAVVAEVTVTFIGRKVGQVLSDGLDYCGELIFDELGISRTTRFSQAPALEVIDEGNVCLPPKRKINSHKNLFGHVLVIGGDRGMVGAASLAAQAALRAGAGMVSVLVHPDCVHDLATIPELMVKGWDDIEDKLPQTSVVVVGPGLGQSKAAQACCRSLHQSKQPMVIDASALSPEFLQALSSREIVITPHPGEAAGLLKTTGHAVQGDRLGASDELSRQFPVVSVLKGCGTVIRQAGVNPPAINLRGNAGMASAGMGDVLSGIIAAFIGQQLSIYQAARTGVFVHALCAEDFAHEFDETGLIAGDIIHRIPKVIRSLRSPL